jgi:uncharacterized membrane protein
MLEEIRPETMIIIIIVFGLGLIITGILGFLGTLFWLRNQERGCDSEVCLAYTWPIGSFLSGLIIELIVVCTLKSAG